MIEFLEEPHLYLKDGILVKSVTQILYLIFPDKYKGIDKKTLSKKAKFGTKGHSIIENLDVSDLDKAKEEVLKISNKDLQICIREYLRLVKEYGIQPIEQEQIVSYKYLFCGTLDMVGIVGTDNCLLDIKFTAELDKEYLSWQLGMYQLAKGIKYDKCYCIWLPKRELGQLVEIEPKTEKEILNKLEELEIYE